MRCWASPPPTSTWPSRCRPTTGPRSRPAVAPAARVLFVDGVQRVDANVWVTGDDGAQPRGRVRQLGRRGRRVRRPGGVEATEVRRGVLVPGQADLDAVVTAYDTYHPYAVRTTTRPTTPSTTPGATSRCGWRGSSSAGGGCGAPRARWRRRGVVGEVRTAASARRARSAGVGAGRRRRADRGRRPGAGGTGTSPARSGT